MPGSSLGKAHRYTNKPWEGLTVFLDNPAVPIHTNGMGGALRGPAVGRRNHFGSKTLETAKVAAIWYAVIETCRQHQVPTREYLTATLRAILAKAPIVILTPPHDARVRASPRWVQGEFECEPLPDDLPEYHHASYCD